MNKNPISSWLVWTIIVLSVAIVTTILGLGLISEVSLKIAKSLGIIFVILFMTLTIDRIKKIK